MNNCKFNLNHDCYIMSKYTAVDSEYWIDNKKVNYDLLAKKVVDGRVGIPSSVSSSVYP